MISSHQDFINAIKTKHKIQITFYAEKYDHDITRTCAPMDYGPYGKTKSSDDRYHIWDYDSTPRPHQAGLESINIRSITVLDESFDPSEFVTWTTSWYIPRDWGINS